MIVFDLRCDQGHGFETWFPGSAAYEAQRAEGRLVCPYCGSIRVEKAVMAPRLAVAAARDEGRTAGLAKLAALQAKLLKDSTWVGEGFARDARAMAEGEAPLRTIHGVATPDEAAALREDGIGAMPLLFPVVPPAERN